MSSTAYYYFTPPLRVLSDLLLPVVLLCMFFLFYFILVILIASKMSHDLIPLKEVTAIYTFSCSYLCLFGVKMLSPDGSGSSH